MIDGISNESEEVWIILSFGSINSALPLIIRTIERRTFVTFKGRKLPFNTRTSDSKFILISPVPTTILPFTGDYMPQRGIPVVLNSSINSIVNSNIDFRRESDKASAAPGNEEISITNIIVPTMNDPNTAPNNAPPTRSTQPSNNKESTFLRKDAAAQEANIVKTITEKNEIAAEIC